MIFEKCNILLIVLQDCPKSSRDEHLSKYMWIFLIGNLLHGAGGTPLYTLAVTHIDAIVTRKKSSFCLGKIKKEIIS